MQSIDKTYVGLPWKAGGRTRDGLDCAGLARLWLTEQMGLQFNLPDSVTVDCDAEKLLQPDYKHGELERGDVVFMRHDETGKVCHVAIYLGENKYLHILKGCESRIDTGLALLERLGFKIAGTVSGQDATRLCEALRDPNLGTAATVILLIISVALSLASGFLLRPKLGQRNQSGKYSFDALATQTNSTLPLPEVLGAVTLAGNSPYQSMVDKSQAVSDATKQKANFIVVLCSGPMDGFDNDGYTTTINGTAYNDAYYYGTNPNRGLVLNPTADEGRAVDGTFGGDLNRSSFTFYPGTYGITVPVDIRAQYDRDFPIYGLSGSSYMVFRLINSDKFPNFNLNTRVNARQCRAFDSTGFLTTTAAWLNVGNGVDKRFKIPAWDLKSVSGVVCRISGVDTVFTELSASNQTGNVYSVNLTKGYVELLVPLAATDTITYTYTYYQRAWTNNPASHLVYLLTEAMRGKGYPASKINWPSAKALYDYCADSVTWVDASGTTTGPRYTCNYAIDSKKPIQEHIAAVLDSCYGYLFLSGGQFYMKARKSESSVFDFNSSSIIAGSFSSEKIDRSQQANRIHVFFRSTETYGLETEIISDDQSDQDARMNFVGDNGIVEQTLHLPAIDNHAQAARYSEQLLRENVNIRWTCQLTTNVKGLALQPGDVITVTHPAQPAWSAKSFRIEELNYDADDQLVVKASEYFDGAYI